MSGDQPLEGAGWRLALSLVQLRTEINAWAPQRKRGCDGTIGDAAHASRASRHNPNDAGVVCALDITHDPAGGMDVHALARRLALHPHPDLAYVISNRQKASRLTGWQWVPYSGTSPHTAHAHFAVGEGPDSEPRPPYDDQTPWGVAPEEEADVTKAEHDALMWTAMFAKGAELHAAIGAAYAKGAPATALALEQERPKTLALWRKRFGIDTLEASDDS